MKNRLGLVAVLVIALSLVGAACSSSSDSACDALKIENAWVRLPPGPNTAIYMDLVNSGDESISLTGADSDFAAKYELHESKMSDGQMVMEMVPGQEIPVAAGSTTSLEPGGLHVMAIDLEETLAVGDEKTFTLTFTGDCTKEITAPVEMAEMSGEG
jgi:copper(I)-binding protein